jgi:hypothetical protein
MRLPKLKTQHYMVAIVFLAILFWACPVVIPDIQRRWMACRGAAAWHMTEAGRRKADAVYWGKAKAVTAEDKAWIKACHETAARSSEHHSNLSRAYRSALFIPWRLYTVGENPYR